METPSASGDAESRSSVREAEKIEDIHQGPFFTCGLCDKELTYKIAQDLLSGLATACVDGTTGVLFQTPASVAADYRKDMVDYLWVRTQSFVAETVVLETDPGAEVSDHPLDILSVMIDDYALSRKSLFSRVSGLMLTEMREERIDEFAQEMERDSFWLLDKRESVAQNLIKNVDFKGLHYCTMKFGSEKEVAEHQETCGYRPVMCENQGCNDMFSVDSLELHDSICPFKILPCEQNCSELLMRRDMDKHCITDCPMKLTNCSFYSIGCHLPVPHGLIKKHCSDHTHGHLINALQYIHKEASAEDAERWAELIEQSEFSDQLEARDVRTFTMAVKDIEKRIGPFKISQPTTTEDTSTAPSSEQATEREPSSISAQTKPETTPTNPGPSSLHDSATADANQGTTPTPSPEDNRPITAQNEVKTTPQDMVPPLSTSAETEASSFVDAEPTLSPKRLPSPPQDSATVDAAEPTSFVDAEPAPLEESAN